MAVDQTQGDAAVSRGVAMTLALWLGVLLPIGTLIQLSYVGGHLAKLSQLVAAGITCLLIGMVTFSLWAAIGIWQGRRDARLDVERALFANVAASALGCAPLSILMSAPPSFLPTLLVTLIALGALDALWPMPKTD